MLRNETFQLLLHQEIRFYDTRRATRFLTSYLATDATYVTVMVSGGEVAQFVAYVACLTFFAACVFLRLACLACLACPVCDVTNLL